MLVIESITALLMLKNESVSSVFRALQLLLSRCVNQEDCYSHVILINHLESSDGSKSHFSFSDILDTLAVEVFTLETAKKNASDLALWADGWIIVDCFLLKASGSGGHGRIRKGSVKERVGIKLLDVVKKTTLSRRVSELVLEVKPEQTVHLGVNDRKPSGNVVFTPETNPLPNLLPVSSRNDPTSNLSFNLKLTNEQREMKEASVLPYVHTGEGIGVNLAHIGGFIHYEADANDDSEGDPDDDLAL
ncbi:hypothetical protein BDR26DRAFT_915176 [Obelidium mucronatum]|nr:hypothetical protein BDR26DRAFT_915176 [Obelidium mucronatum]